MITENPVVGGGQEERGRCDKRTSSQQWHTDKRERFGSKHSLKSPKKMACKPWGKFSKPLYGRLESVIGRKQVAFFFGIAPIAEMWCGFTVCSEIFFGAQFFRKEFVRFAVRVWC